jgi:hypothetical protein
VALGNKKQKLIFLAKSLQEMQKKSLNLCGFDPELN